MPRTIIISLTLLTVTACTAVDVRPIPASAQMDRVCIVDNPRVTIQSFVPVLIDGFARHGIAADVVSSSRAAGCDYTLTYTALRSWDVSTYLSHAELRINQHGRQVGYAEYHLRGKGGLSLNKWGSVKSKMDPVIDELLAAYKLPD